MSVKLFCLDCKVAVEKDEDVGGMSCECQHRNDEQPWYYAWVEVTDVCDPNGPYPGIGGRGEPEAIDFLRMRISALEAENARLLQAIGLATTAVPSMVMRPNDPIGMMQEVCAENARLREALKRSVETAEKLAHKEDAFRRVAYPVKYRTDIPLDAALGARSVSRHIDPFESCGCGCARILAERTEKLIDTMQERDKLREAVRWAAERLRMGGDDEQADEAMRRAGMEEKKGK